MRRLGYPVVVNANPDGTPGVVQLDQQPRRVRQVLDRWVEAGRWWDGEGPRRFYRIDADGLFDLSCDEAGTWRVEVAWD